MTSGDKLDEAEAEAIGQALYQGNILTLGLAFHLPYYFCYSNIFFSF